jgi:xanthine/uracil permease
MREGARKITGVCIAGACAGALLSIEVLPYLTRIMPDAGVEGRILSVLGAALLTSVCSWAAALVPFLKLASEHVSIAGVLQDKS